MPKKGGLNRTNVFLIIIVVLVIGFGVGRFTYSNYNQKLDEPIVLTEFNFPSEAQQNQVIFLETEWKSQKEIMNNDVIFLYLFTSGGTVVAKYFLHWNLNPASSSKDGYKYLENHSVHIPYLKSGIYMYNVVVRDTLNDRNTRS